MPVFHFHMREGDELVEDPEGIDLPDIEAAREEALAAAREILAEKLKRGEMVDGQTFEITNDLGEVQARVRLRDVLKLSLEPPN